jgi:colicin V production protein
MNNISVAIILIIVSFGILGLKRGALKEAVIVFGNILVIAIAYFFKDMLASYLMNALPAYKINSVLGPLSSLTIIFYKLIAFLALMIVFHFLLRIIINLSGLLGKIMDATVILLLPNRIIGFILGILEGYVLMFIVLNVLMIPLSSNTTFMDSGVRKYIVEETPILKDSFGGLNTSLEEVMQLDKNDNENSLNLKVIGILLKNKIITKDEVEELANNGKIVNVEGLDTVINKY